MHWIWGSLRLFLISFLQSDVVQKLLISSGALLFNLISLLFNIQLNAKELHTHAVWGRLHPSSGESLNEQIKHGAKS